MRMSAVLTIAAAIMVWTAGDTRAAVCGGGDGAGACGVRTDIAAGASQQTGSVRPVQVAERIAKRRKRAAEAPYDDAPTTGYRDLPGHMVPGQIFPNRPPGASPYECYTDDGGGRFRPCSAGDMR
jgi:hypothetical protein